MEAVEDTNRERLHAIGADNVIRPMRAYPELLVRTIVAKGIEQVIETLFNRDNEECVRLDIDIQCNWEAIMFFFIQKDIGTPIAYEDANGTIINNPSSKALITARALFIIINEKKVYQLEEAQLELEKLSK